MKYTSINIQGNLISEEILQKIEEADVQGQLAKDFGFEPGINLRSEIEYAWSRIKLDWKHFSERIEKLPPSDPYGTTLARKWMLGFFNTLGFEISLQKTSLQGDNEQQYTISHTCNLLDGLPVHIAGFYDPNHPQKNTLDIRSSGGTTRMSPHATIQEYLNVTEHLYGMVTNGMLLRLVRDSGRLVKLTYIEFDLKRLLDEDKYSEFTLLYRLLHASRFPKIKQETEESLLEKYYQDSIESGNRIRNGLSSAVKESLIALGNGLLEHPENEKLRERVSSGRPDPRDFYHQLLRLIYRLLFLMVTEERDLIIAEIQDENQEPDLDDILNGIKRPTKKQKEIYYQYYSLIRLRKLSEKRYLQENQYTDLWQGLLQTFALFESGGTGNKLGILALGSELFSGNAMPDITSSKLNNKVLLQCIRSLNEFEDAKHNLSFINYRALDVEELGSVYEGLLELEPIFEWENRKPKFSFKKGSERSSSGSHYTPEDLVKPLIQHSLEYLIEERTADFYKEKATEAETKKKLLDLKVCDVACGSGHILLSAARRIAIEVARVETGEQQPNPTSFRHALKDVIRNCIYGVDKNPLAVELCKVALWLESHNPGEPLSFLDHRIKCGDAIVGLAHREELQNGIANEAYKLLPGDDKVVVSTYQKKNKQERLLREKSKQAVQLTTTTDYKLLEQVKKLNKSIEHFSNLPENLPEEIEQKEKAYKNLINSETLKRLKIMANLQIMPFFIEKTEKSKEYLLTDDQYHRYLRGEVPTPFRIEIKAVETATRYRFFHWFLEFPQVFQRGGFDCILGNPPYLGGQKISGAYGFPYLNFLKSYIGINSSPDLIAFFLRRNFSVIKSEGFTSIISTNSISEGKTREASLSIIEKDKGIIIHANPNTKWIGVANVYVSLISIVKRNNWNRIRLLASKEVNYINAHLTDDEELSKPYILKRNNNLSFQGSIILGKGFLLDSSSADQFPSEVVFKYLNGDDINSNPECSSTRKVINVTHLDLTEIQNNYPSVYKKLEKEVKPQREAIIKNKTDQGKTLGIHDERASKEWWRYLWPRTELYNKISDLSEVIVVPRVTKFLNFIITDSNHIFSDATVVFAFNSYSYFGLMQSCVHEVWVRFNSSSLENRLRYAPTDCFETFPFSTDTIELNSIGNKLYKYRQILLKSYSTGLTKLYNRFHNPLETDEKIMELRLLHEQLDKRTIGIYNFNLDLKHNFYEVDYLPENDRIRFTIHPDARKEILKRLLELNHKIHEEEVKAGLWDNKSGNKRTTKSKTKTNQLNEGEAGYGGLFG